MTINFQIKEVNAKHAYGTLTIAKGNKETIYELFAGSAFLNVATGHALKLRSSGKAFQTVQEIHKHYKKDGEILASHVNELIALKNAA